jgi:NAD(P)-dependent dehydrogenase (short-subunit alcohol dehydrogenase family)
MKTPTASAPVPLVTGADRGIGLETARRLVAAEFHVYLTARDPEPGKRAADASGAQSLEPDVTSEASAGHAAETIGTADGLVDNAGITGPLRDAGDYTATVLQTNVVGYVRMIHAFLPLRERSAGPRIVKVSSGMVRSGSSPTRAGSSRASARRSTARRRRRSTCSPPGTRGCCRTSAPTPPIRA